MIEAEYTVSYSDYKAAMRLFTRHSTHCAIRWAITFLLLTPFSLFTSLISLWPRLIGSGRPGHPLHAALNMGIACFFPLLYHLSLRRGYRNLFLLSDSKQLLFRADQSGLLFHLASKAESRYEWGAVKRWYQNKNCLILFVSKVHFLLLPQHALSESQWKEFRGMIAAHVSQGVK